MSDLQSRIEFALRDAGFSNREAATLARRAAAVPDREKVARALYEHAIANWGAVKWEDWLAKADAAIAAMGEP